MARRRDRIDVPQLGLPFSDGGGGRRPPSMLHAALDPGDYEAGSSLAGVREWKARILIGNSMAGDKRVGEMDDVGCVMVRLAGEPSFIPVAVSDEHNRGFDLLQSRSREWGVRSAEWSVVYARDTGVFLYDSSEIPEAMEALRRWHAAGGPEVEVRSTGYNDLQGARWRIGSRDFIAGRGSPVLSGDGLLPIGQRCIDVFSAAGDALRRLRSAADPRDFSTGDKGGMRALANAAGAVVSFFEAQRAIAFEVFYDYGKGGFVGGATCEEALGAWAARLDGALLRDDAGAVERALFGHDGLKNRLHMRIREEAAPRYGPGALPELFGDMRLAHDALGRISPGIGPVDADDEAQEDPAAPAPM